MPAPNENNLSQGQQTEQAGGFDYPVTPPGSLDKCRKTNDPCIEGEYESTLMGQRLCCKRAGGGDCAKDEDCPMGQKCVDGKCKTDDSEPVCPESYIPPQGKDAHGKVILIKPCNAGWTPKTFNDRIYCCKDTSVSCAKDEDCPEGQTCVSGKCKKGTTPTGDCPEGIGSDKYDGCPCGKKYTTMTGKCASGYALISRTGTGWEGWKEGAVGKCECIKWCKDIGYGEDCNTPTKKQGGEFKWSPELQALLKRLTDRIQSLFDNPRGTTPQERQTIINYMSEGIKRGERPRLQSSQDQMARMGILGSGLELGEYDRIKRGTDEMLTNTKRQVAIDELDRRFQELTGASGLAGNLLGTSMSAEQIPEVLSAARRGEGRQDMSMLMNYFSTLMGGQNSAFAPYLQAILAQRQGQGGQGSDSSWLPWLMYLLMPQGRGTGTGVTRK